MGGKTTTKNTIPGWLSEGSQQATALGRRIGNQQYQAYGGRRVAALSSNEQQASQLATTGSQAAQSDFNSARSALGSQREFSQSAIDQYSNPYMDRVLGARTREANRAYGAERSRLNNTAGKVAAFGGDRATLRESQLQKNYLEGIDDLTNESASQAFEFATRSFFQDEERKQRSAEAYRALGGDVSRMNSQQIQDLMATGGVGRLLEQANLDFDYQQFTENRDWDIRNLQPLLASLNVPHDTTTVTKKQPGVAQILGAAVSIGGAFFTGGASLAGLAGVSGASGSLAGAAASGVGSALMGGSVMPGTALA